MSALGDKALGPQFNSEGDFTLTFEHLFLTIIPTLLFILFSPLILHLYTQEPDDSGSEPLLLVRLATGTGLLVAEAVALAFWNSIPTEGYRSGTAIAAAVLSLIASLLITVILFAEYRRSLRTTAVLTVYLSINVVVDIIKTRTYFSRPQLPGLDTIGIISLVGLVLKATLIVLEELPKKSHLGRDNLQKLFGKESVSGFWNRSLFLWLNSTFSFGFRNILAIDDLDNLGPELDAKSLSTAFRKVWRKADHGAKFCLALSCLGAFWRSFFITVPPRLCHIGFNFVQPYLLQSIIVAYQQGTLLDIENGLILGTVLVFFGIGITRSSYTHLTNRFIARIRSVFITEVYDKMLDIPQPEAEKSAAVTLMSTEIDSMILGLEQFHDVWSAFVEIGISIWLLYSMVTKSSFLVIPPAIVSTWVAYEIGRRMGPAREAWNSFIETRVSKTSNILTQIKSWKLMGIGPVLTEYIQSLRVEEMVYARRFRRLTAAMLSSAMFMTAATPIVVVAGALFWSTYNGHLDAAKVFPLLAILYLAQDPLSSILMYYPNVMSTMACIGRVQSFLFLREMRQISPAETARASAHSEAVEKGADNVEIAQRRLRAPLPTTDQHVVQFFKTCIAPERNKPTVLTGVNINITRGSLTMVTSRTGGGKTTLLRAIIGGAEIVQGSMNVDPRIGYCGQHPWICNDTIRKNIVSEYTFDPAWYAAITKACMLDEDIGTFPGGDQFLAGSGGANLSGGQKHRLAIARAVYCRVQTIVLDDVFRALDRSTAASIFCNLLGKNGLLKKTNTTVIMATSTTSDWLDLASDVLYINNSGEVSTHTNAARPSLSNASLYKLLSQSDLDENETKTKRSHDREPPQPNENTNVKLEEEKDLLRQKGSIKLYTFYLKSTGWLWLLLFCFLTALVSLSERLPQIFIRIWIEIDPNNMDYFIAFALMGVMAGVASFLNLYFYWFRLVPHSAEALHLMLVEVVMRARLSFLTATDGGTILNRFSQDMTLMAQDLPLTFWKCIYLSFLIILDICVLVSGVTYAATAIPFICASLYVVKKFYLRTSRQIRYLDLEAKTPLYTLFTETASGLEHIRCFGWQSRYKARNIELLEKSQKAFYHMYSIQRWLALVMDMLAMGLAVAVTTLVLKLGQVTTPAGFGLTFLNIITIGAAMTSFVKRWTDMETSLGAIARLRSFLKSTPTEKHQGDFHEVAENWPQQGHIVMNHVSASYRQTDDRHTLHNISLNFRPGKKAAIVGRTGSGKSSIITAMLNFLDYTGSIQVDGVELSHIAPETIRSRITTITQDRINLDSSVRNNLIPQEILLPKERQTEDSVIFDALRQVGLADHYTGRLDGPMADVGLSAGQHQLFSIARAIIHHKRTNSKIVLLDEPTNSIGAEEETAMHRIMAEVFSACTVVTVTHRLETLQSPDIVVELENGTVASYTD